MNTFRFDFLPHCYVVDSSLVLGLKPVIGQPPATSVTNFLVKETFSR